MVVGYTQGTFDMFHIGHLNLLKRAREKCDKLIVGVNTDELVKNYKNKMAIIPLEERMAIISELRCVDQVIKCETLDKLEIYKRFPFQRLFIGDDWKNNSRYIETEKQLMEVGASVIYLPYTKNTSSTLLREKLTNY